MKYLVTTQALQGHRLHEEQPDNPLFAWVLCEVYVGLTDDEALRLPAGHNKNGHYIHAMTDRDYGSFCCKAHIAFSWMCLVEVFTVNFHWILHGKFI